VFCALFRILTQKYQHFLYILTASNRNRMWSAI